MYIKEAELHNYLSDFEYDRFDPALSYIMEDDKLLSYFKWARKSNYKPGMGVTSLGVYENEKSLSSFFEIHYVANLFLYKALKGEVSEDEVTIMQKSFGARDMSCSMTALITSLQELAMTLCLFKKGEMAGPEVAKKLIELMPASISKVESCVKDFSAQSLKNLQASSPQSSLEIQLFGSFVPFTVEFLGEALRTASPNMKKKKDPSFDDLKKQVIKPIKE